MNNVVRTRRKKNNVKRKTFKRKNLKKNTLRKVKRRYSKSRKRYMKNKRIKRGGSYIDSKMIALIKSIRNIDEKYNIVIDYNKLKSRDEREKFISLITESFELTASEVLSDTTLLITLFDEWLNGWRELWSLEEEKEKKENIINDEDMRKELWTLVFKIVKMNISDTREIWNSEIKILDPSQTSVEDKKQGISPREGIVNKMKAVFENNSN